MSQQMPIKPSAITGVSEGAPSIELGSKYAQGLGLGDLKAYDASAAVGATAAEEQPNEASAPTGGNKKKKKNNKKKKKK